MITFEIEQHGKAPRSVEVSHPLVLIGRGAACHVQVAAPEASSRHCRVRVYADKAVLEDLDSTNGTFIGGQRVGPPVVVGAGSEFSLGEDGPTVRVVDGVPPAPSTTTDQKGAGGGLSRTTAAVALGLSCVVAFVGALTVAGVAVGMWYAYSGPQPIDSIHDDALERAIGLVIVGFESPGADKPYRPAVTGTGFVVTPDGYLLTNRHVVSGMLDGSLKTKFGQYGEVKVWVALQGEVFDARVVYASPSQDLAILSIDREDDAFFRLAQREEDLDLLTEVFAYGFPGAGRVALSDEEQVEDAIRTRMPHSTIRACFKERDFDVNATKGEVATIAEESDGRVWAQHTARISSGNSGGPLLLASGKVVAINTQVHAEIAGVYFSLMTGQLRKEIDRHAPGVRWD